MNQTVLEKLLRIDKQNIHLLMPIMGLIQESIFAKNDIFIQEGSYKNKVGYVLEGNLISIKYINEKEVVHNFFTANSWIGNIEGYNDDKNSASIKCVDSCKIAWIDSKILKAEFIKEPKLKIFELHFFTKVISIASHQLINFKSMTPMERFQNLITERPKVFKYFSNYHIASYLGVSPETLSRLKNRDKSIS